MITYTFSGTIERVVLMRPGSVTHSFDFDQRYVQVPFQVTGSGTLQITALPPKPGTGVPSTTAAAPDGHYMLWLLSSQGTPSEAKWVELQ